MKDNPDTKTLRSVHITRLDSGVRRPVTDSVIVEAPLTLVVNGAVLTTLYCTPTDLEDLVCGFLLSEGLLQRDDFDALTELRIDQEAQTAHVSLDHKPLDRQNDAGSIAARSANDNDTVKSHCHDWRSISEASARLLLASPAFERTGAAHGAGLWRASRFLAIREDVGRHNAVDKIGGAILRGSLDTRGAAVFVTGRVSADLVNKCVRFGIETLVSRGAPTDLAVRLAREARVTLVGFSRGERMNVYSGTENITANKF